MTSDRRAVEERAHAKLNLRLRVLGRETSGYHSLETVYMRVALHDDVCVEPAEGVELRVEAAAAGAADGVPDGPANLAWRAVEAFGETAGSDLESAGARVTLRKRIPPGAGLGGGSADAAAVLRGLNALHGRPVEPARLLKAASRLGSDVPFALAGVAAAVGWGRGTRLLPFDPPPARPALLVFPGFPLATADAYEWLREERTELFPGPGEVGGGGVDAARSVDTSGPASGTSGTNAAASAVLLPEAGELARWEKLLPLAVNDFEAVVYPRHPELERWRDRLAEAGADVALLAGSGSCLFGLFPGEEERDRCARALGAEADDAVRLVPTAVPARSRG